MRIHSGQVSSIAGQIVKALIDAGDIESESPREVVADIESVLSQYSRDEQAATERARDVLAARRLSTAEFGRMKRLAAEERGIKIGEDAIDYLLDQLLEMLMHSGNVDEIYADDLALRRKMRIPLRKQLQSEDALEKEVRGRLKHVKEGTSMWDIEYARMKEDIKNRKGL